VLLVKINSKSGCVKVFGAYRHWHQTRSPL